MEPSIVQLEGYAKTKIKAIQVAKDSSQLDTHSFIKFCGPEGKLEQIHKAIAKDNSHSIFNGIIEVPKVAQKTDASQLSKNLILSKNAIIDTKPELRIVADDVRCSHGATISQFQDEEIFYLQSRGISYEKAAELLLEGYCKEIINLIPLKPSRWSNLNNLLISKK